MVRVGKTPYVRFDTNDYSVPHDRVRRSLVVLASPTRVRVLEGCEAIADHARSWARGQQVEDARHIEALALQKRGARQERGTDRLHHAVPASRALLEAQALRGGNLGAVVQALGSLLDAWGAAELQIAVAEALENDAPHVHTVRQILERRRHVRGQLPPVAVQLPDDRRVRELAVKPHALSTYDALTSTENPDDDQP